jgi:hypothetical protein
VVRVLGALTAALAAAALVPSAAALPPRAGLVVPGKTLGGLSLGASREQVWTAWGKRYGVCRDCRLETWYFNFTPGYPQGAGVSFRKGRAVALFTVWGPPGWRTNRGLRIDDPEIRIAGIYGALLRVECGNYSALTLRRGRVTTSIYVFNGRVWGFGLSRSEHRVCR